MKESMDTTFNMPSGKPALRARLMAYPLMRMFLGIVLTFVWVPLTMIAAHQLFARPYRQVWPQLLAAVLAWFGYRVWVRRIDKRQPDELALPGVARALGAGVLLGSALLVATFAVLAVLNIYRYSGVNALSPMLLVPLADMILVALTEELLFRGVVFGVVERWRGSRAAVVVSTLAFTSVHLPNPGISVLAVVSLLAFGLLLAALVMMTRRLWIGIGVHLGWNYCLGTLFASTVSGHAATTGVLRGELAGSTLLTGGAFGIEASLVTAVLIGAAAAFSLRRASRVR
jgi:membrane protease YdiL (CAAX protease family)